MKSKKTHFVRGGMLIQCKYAIEMDIVIVPKLMRSHGRVYVLQGLAESIATTAMRPISEPIVRRHVCPVQMEERVSPDCMGMEAVIVPRVSIPKRGAPHVYRIILGLRANRARIVIFLMEIV